MVSHPRIGSYSSLRGDGSPLIVNGKLDLDRVRKLARWSDATLDLGPLSQNPQIAEALRRANPSLRLHAYVVLIAADWPGPFFTEFQRIVTSTEGVLTCVDAAGRNRKPWFFTNVNLARPATAAQLAAHILNYVSFSGPWSAIFVDLLIPQLLSCQQGNPQGGYDYLDWKGMGYPSEAAFLEAWQVGADSFFRQLKLSGKPVSSNYGNSFPYGNGCMIEAAFAQRGGTWEKNMLMNGSQPGLLKLSFAEPRNGWICTEPVFNEPHTSPENQRRHRYGLASACLSGDFHSFGRYESNAQWCVDRLDWWYPEYQHPQRGKHWLGEPQTGALHVLTDYHGKPTDLYMRSFEHGVAVVNTTNIAQSIGFGTRRYRPINGVAKSSFSIPPHDGLLAEAV
jgi:hypothetical protein